LTPIQLSPAFGQADLSNCEREQIHLAGTIQPHGAMLVVREPSHVIVQASASAAAFLGLDGPIVGRALGDLPGDLIDRIRPHLSQGLSTIPLAVRCAIGAPPLPFDSLLHRPPEGGLVIELERAGPAIDVSRDVENAVPLIVSASSLRVLCDETARIFKELTGYDRVMVYRFDDAGHGEVYSERREAHLEPYLGNRYPASDIPQMARRLYERNRVRVLVDVDYVPVPLEPQLSPITGRELDMSLCFLRSMSPIHIQYLKNMGVAATLVVSLVVGGKLWGLIACHHYEARFLHYELRAVCELLAEVVATRIAALESFVQAQAEQSVRRLEQRMLETVARDGDWTSALFDSSRSLLQPLEATGAALLFEGQVLTAGEVPGTQQLRELGRWLDSRPRGAIIATSSLGLDEPQFKSLASVASGMIAAPVSDSPGEYLLWFRPEQVRTVTWGGDPLKPVLIGNSPSDLSPRRSFAQWHQLVEGTAEQWTAADRSAARLIGESVTDVVLQFRAVRVLIAQNQLAQVNRQVNSAGMPVLVADQDGHVLMTNEAFDRLMRPGHAPVRSIADLANLFAQPIEFRRAALDFVRNKHPWRAEISLKTDHADARALLIRGDPVFASPEQLLGFVLLLTDLTEAKAADIARRRFQEEIVEHNRVTSVRLDSRTDLVYRNLLMSVLGNAQLAALEITDGMDPGRMPEMLDSVRASADRTAQLLERLLWHATGGAAGEGGG